MNEIYMVEHYLELHDYISENIYRLDNSNVVLESIDFKKWGIIGLIIVAVIAAYKIIMKIFFKEDQSKKLSDKGKQAKEAKEKFEEKSGMKVPDVTEADKKIEEIKKEVSEFEQKLKDCNIELNRSDLTNMRIINERIKRNNDFVKELAKNLDLENVYYKDRITDQDKIYSDRFKFNNEFLFLQPVIMDLNHFLETKKIFIGGISLGFELILLMFKQLFETEIKLEAVFDLKKHADQIPPQKLEYYRQILDHYSKDMEVCFLYNVAPYFNLPQIDGDKFFYNKIVVKNSSVKSTISKEYINNKYYIGIKEIPIKVNQGSEERFIQTIELSDELANDIKVAENRGEFLYLDNPKYSDTNTFVDKLEKLKNHISDKNFDVKQYSKWFKKYKDNFINFVKILKDLVTHYNLLIANRLSLDNASESFYKTLLNKIIKNKIVKNIKNKDNRMHEDIKKFADEGNIKELKYKFSSSLDVDPTFEKYKKDFEYCKEKNVFEPYKELTPFETDKSKWNRNYWANLKQELIDNFSQKRLEHMIEVAKVVYKDKIERLKKEREEDN